MDKILIVDDDRAIRSSLTLMLSRSGKVVEAVATPAEAIATVRRAVPRLILMDMNFGLSTTGEEGLFLLRQIKVLHPEVPVILMTAWGSIPLAVEGMQAGAFDFITKPWNNLLLMQRIETALELTADSQPTEADEGFNRSLIVGESEALKEVLGVVKRIARTNASVLIAGENGTGKELVAETIHRNSLRANQNFVKVNLGGISQTLFESEMFGHRKGAFTGAVADRTGRFELAEKVSFLLRPGFPPPVHAHRKSDGSHYAHGEEDLRESHPHDSPRGKQQHGRCHLYTRLTDRYSRQRRR